MAIEREIEKLDEIKKNHISFNLKYAKNFLYFLIDILNIIYLFFKF